MAYPLSFLDLLLSASPVIGPGVTLCCSDVNPQLYPQSAAPQTYNIIADSTTEAPLRRSRMRRTSVHALHASLRIRTQGLEAI